MKSLISVTALVIALAACENGGSDEAAAPATTGETSAEATPPPASPEADLEDAYRTYIKAFLTGDGATAYALLSERCRAGEPLSEFAAVAESAAELYGQVDYTVDSVTVNGDEGQVDATYAVEALNSGGGSEWVKEDGSWHSDKCD